MVNLSLAAQTVADSRKESKISLSDSLFLLSSTNVPSRRAHHRQLQTRGGRAEKIEVDLDGRTRATTTGSTSCVIAQLAIFRPISTFHVTIISFTFFFFSFYFPQINTIISPCMRRALLSGKPSLNHGIEDEDWIAVPWLH